MKAGSWLWIVLLLAACNLASTSDITPETTSATPNTIPTATEPTPDDGGMIATATQPAPAGVTSNPVPIVGAPGLEPSGAGPCVLTAAGSQSIAIHHAPADSSPIIAMLGAGLGEIPFELRSGWYAISWYSGLQEIVGWLPESRIQLKGECNYLNQPAVCSVEPAVGRDVDIYAEPRRDAAVVGVLGDRYTAPFVEQSANGWYGIYMGESPTGWIAPDEGRLVGC